MSCPNCDHTMQGITSNTSGRIFWCPRCGTLKTVRDALEIIDSPSAIGRLRKIVATHLVGGTIARDILELVGQSIKGPEDPA